MSEVHYFQRYSQRENVATNNTMLLFSRLYNESTYKFNKFIIQLLNDDNLEIGVKFLQQENSKNSTPDGTMSQTSFKIVIETKLYSNDFYESQLKNHLKSFKNEKKKILLALSPTGIEEVKFKEIEAKLKEEDTEVLFLNITFKDIINSFNDIILEYDIQLKEIIDDYEDYCVQEGLVKDAESRIRIVPCGNSLDVNKKYGIYYMPATRNVSEHGYLGVYKDKKVSGIGKILNEVEVKVAHKEENFNIEVLKEKYPLTVQQKERLRGIIRETREKIGWGLDNVPHKYTIVEKFYETDYIKKSKGGIMGHRYQNLKDILKVTDLPDDEKIAELLKGKEWE